MAKKLPFKIRPPYKPTNVDLFYAGLVEAYGVSDPLALVTYIEAQETKLDLSRLAIYRLLADALVTPISLYIHPGLTPRDEWITLIAVHTIQALSSKMSIEDLVPIVLTKIYVTMHLPLPLVDILLLPEFQKTERLRHTLRYLSEDPLINLTTAVSLIALSPSTWSTIYQGLSARARELLWIQNPYSRDPKNILEALSAQHLSAPTDAQWLALILTDDGVASWCFSTNRTLTKPMLARLAAQGSAFVRAQVFALVASLPHP